MNLEDEFNDFVVNELIDSSSLDGEKKIYLNATNIIADKSLNEPCCDGSIVGHKTVNRERLSWHYSVLRLFLR
jgi:hypothetical protein